MLTNLNYIKEVTEGNAEFMQSLIDIFLSQLPEFEREICESSAQHDWPRLAAVAHKAKSSIASMGMDELAVGLKRLEMLAKTFAVEQNVDSPTKQTDDYARQLSNLPPELESWIAQNKTEKSVEELIKLYKLHTQIAQAELAPPKQ